MKPNQTRMTYWTHFPVSRVWGVLLALGLCLVLPAQAREVPATKAEVAAVRRAQRAYELGQFEQALTDYGEVYRLKASPKILFNIAQCHRQLGNYERAAFFYRRYLALSPKKPPNEAIVVDLIAEVEAKPNRLRREEATRTSAIRCRKGRGRAEGSRSRGQARRGDKTAARARPRTCHTAGPGRAIARGDCQRAHLQEMVVLDGRWRVGSRYRCGPIRSEPAQVDVARNHQRSMRSLAGNPKMHSGVVIFLALAVGACSDSETAFLVRVKFDQSLGLTQLQFSGNPENGPGFGPIRKPDLPGLPLSSGQTVRIRFPDAYAGQTVSLDVDGLVEGRAVVASQVRAVLARKRTVQITLELTPDNVDGGWPDGGSTCVDCQSGCCVGSRCYPQPSFSLCGIDAGLCIVCNRQFSDNCTTGICRCGGGSACSDGQECDGGVCTCTAYSCPTGCCMPDRTCLYPPEVPWTPRQEDKHCGNVGLNCVECNRCDAGVCIVPQSQCQTGGICFWCNSHCASGCCSGNACLPGNSVTACGNNRRACTVCDPITANNCFDGGCQCGSGPPCVAFSGQHCVGVDGGDYQCVCDAQLCSPGCCQDRWLCQSGTTESACGSRGDVCNVCDPPSRCVFQRCQITPAP
jgi:hypothetical protein